MKRGSSLRFIEWPMPATSGLVLGGIGLLLEPLGGKLDRLDDVHVAGAAAQVPRDGLADVLLAGVGILGEERRARHHHAGRTIAALQTMFFPEALLDGMQ